MLTATDLLIILAILDTHKPPPPTRLVVAVEAAMDAARANTATAAEDPSNTRSEGVDYEHI